MTCVFVFMFSCNNNDDASTSECDFNIVIDGELYEEPSPSTYNVANAAFYENCLEITFSSGGCDGESWEVELISDYPIVFGNNITAAISLKLTNSELYEAYITKSYSFDLSDIHGDNTHTVFVLEGWEGELEVNN